ncbi:MAG: hypothetical protein JRJ19_07315 [Deltaproteobacteria bacterium]|nr:hypothetical protein [Deltaproteobacteria bacterium]
MKVAYSHKSEDHIDRIGSGHIGGKARGLSFFHRLFYPGEIQQAFAPHSVRIPETTVITTEAFEQFVDDNNLFETIHEKKDSEVLRRFHDCVLRQEWVAVLEEYLKRHPFPLAIRSSSLNEDAFNHPFAGLFLTLLLPNNHPDLKTRLHQLIDAIKAVFASTYFQSPQAYMAKHRLPIEHEKMAVILQQLVGRPHGNYFYPRIAGVGQSLNFFPVGHITPDDGIALAVLGLGKMAVEGDRVMRFCPKYPTVRPQMYSSRDFLRYTQTHFVAVDLTTGGRELTGSEMDTLVTLPISVAEKQNTLQGLVSTWDPRDRTLYDGTFHKGRKVLTFNSILKGGLFPLGEMIDELLTRFKEGFHSAVDMDYAVELDRYGGLTHATFYLLQARPLVARSYQDDVKIPDQPAERTLIRTANTMGAGKLKEIKYVVYVNSSQLDPNNSRKLADATAKIDRFVHKQGEQYILIGPGRWGSTNPRLGIPVTFAQIANAAVIAETSAPGLDFEPSQGTHFFHLITAGGIVYMAVIPEAGDVLNRSVLDSLEVELSIDDVLLMKPSQPLEVVVDGRSSQGIVYITEEPKEKEFVPDWEAGDFD